MRVWCERSLGLSKPLYWATFVSFLCCTKFIIGALSLENARCNDEGFGLRFFSAGDKRLDATDIIAKDRHIGIRPFNYQSNINF